jgi:hypothetical protein
MMDIRALIAAMPFLRKLWTWLPGPMRVIVIVFAVIVAIVRWFADDDEEPDGFDVDVDAAADAPSSDAPR